MTTPSRPSTVALTQLVIRSSYGGATLDRSQAILAAARSVFTRSGYRGASIDEIARTAGVAKGSVYTYFASKDALFAVVVAETVAAVEAVAVRALDDELPFVTSLNRALRAALSARARSPLMMRLDAEAASAGTPAVIAALRRMEATLVRFTEGQLMLALAHGAIRPHPRRGVAVALVAAHAALLAEAGATAGRIPEADALGSMDLLARGLCLDVAEMNRMTDRVVWSF